MNLDLQAVLRRARESGEDTVRITEGDDSWVLTMRDDVAPYYRTPDPYLECRAERKKRRAVTCTEV